MGATETARLETFADGVMAIAITLLILEIAVPHAREGESLGTALADQWPSYAAYVVSFFTIGIMWVNHHHMFTLIERTTHTFLMLNVIFLMTIAALPWPTALIAEYIRDPGRRPMATLVYGGTMIAIAVMYNVVWRYAVARGLLRPDVDPEGVRRASRGYLAGPTVYAAITLLALINAWISLALFALFALYWLLPSSGPRPGLIRSADEFDARGESHP
ncbi:MAG: TMEM175 family protein [Actinomycetota bacterium]